MIRAHLVIAGLTLIAGPVSAQTIETPPRATASITIERSLTVSSVQPMSFGSSTANAEISGVSEVREAVIRVTGDPGRVYRVTIPEAILAQPGDLEVDAFAIVSDNAGDITQTLTARMDSAGVDRLRISGRLRQTSGIALVNVTAAVPVGVDYE